MTTAAADSRGLNTFLNQIESEPGVRNSHGRTTLACSRTLFGAGRHGL